MRSNVTMTLGIVAGLGLMSIASTTSAAALKCDGAKNSVEVNSAYACNVQPGPFNDSADSGGGVATFEDGLVFLPGPVGPFDWTYLDKDNRGNETDGTQNQFTDPPAPIAGAQEDWFSGTITNLANLTGTFSINVGAYTGLGFNTFMLFVKPGNEGFYFLLDGTPVNGILSGTWTISGAPGCVVGNAVNPRPCPGNAISHMSLYGWFDDEKRVPEPGSLALLGLGLAGLGAARRRKAG